MQDLVPCVLLSFEREHILIWRGRDWKSSLEPTESLKGLQEVKTDLASGLSAAPSPSILNSCINEERRDDLEKTISPTSSNGKSQGDGLLTEAGAEDTMALIPDISLVASHQVRTDTSIDKSVTSPGLGDYPSEPCNQSQTADSELELHGSVESLRALENPDNIAAVSDLVVVDTESNYEQMSPQKPCTEEIMILRKKAVENGMAVMLDRDSLDADIVFRRAVAFAKTAPTGPVFGRRAKQLPVEKDKVERDESGSKEAQVVIASEIRGRSGRDERKSSTSSKKMEDIKGDYLNVVPQGNLRVDELAKLLA